MIFVLLKYLAFCHSSLLPYYFLLATNSLSLPAPIDLPVDRSRNAVWLEHRWLQGQYTEEDLQTLVEVIQNHGMQYVFPHLAPSDLNGRLPAFSHPAAKHFRKYLQDRVPGLRILPWIGGVQVGYQQMNEGTIQLQSDLYLLRFANEALFLVHEMQFDGIHLNIEPVLSGDSALLNYLRLLKSKIGREKILSLAAFKPSYIEGVNISPLHSWDLNYIESLAAVCDQIVIMNYDTSIPEPALYEFFTRTKLEALLVRLAEKRLPVKILLGVPTYDSSRNHDARVENIQTALSAVRSVVLTQQQFEGIALYAYWTTDSKEWKEFSDLWVNAGK